MGFGGYSSGERADQELALFPRRWGRAAARDLGGGPQVDKVSRVRTHKPLKKRVSRRKRRVEALVDRVLSNLEDQA
jgi:hypothetical protein